jgi:hypothetical protein
MSMSKVRLLEKETGIEVLAEAHCEWPPYPRYTVINYPSGRSYALPDAEVEKFFDMIRPQEIALIGFGAVDDRPTETQRKLNEP